MGSALCFSAIPTTAPGVLLRLSDVAPATQCFLRVITFDVFGCVLKHSEKESRDGGMNMRM